MSSANPSRAWLIALPGAVALDPMELAPTIAKNRFVIGRSKECDFRLPIDAEEVSRRHAEFVFQDGQWGVADLGSRWGTAVNGMKIAPNQLIQIGQGDLIRVHPWTFRFKCGGLTSASTVHIEEDDSANLVRTLSGETAEPLRQDMLNLLLEASSLIQTAQNEEALVKLLTDMARRGTGMSNAVVLRALDVKGNVEPFIPDQAPAMRFSRSLLSAAARGVVAEFTGGADVDIAQSLIQANVRSAICAPLMIGPAVTAYLYVDSRGPAADRFKSFRPNASGFCQALARMGALALANLKRLEIERRAALMESELKAAGVAQQWILPRGPIVAGNFTCSGQTRPGGYLGGDFFDAQVLADGKLAVTLGDVSGHGGATSILMTAAQGFLHASMADHGDLTRAVANLNAFLRPRIPTDKFITLWTGLFDPKEMTLTYIDAGHGYSLHLKADGSLEKLDQSGGPPIGIGGGDYEQATISLSPGGRVLVFSDGIIEQPGTEANTDGSRNQFGVEGLTAAINSAGPTDVIEHIIATVKKFAGSTDLCDDATGILVRWG